MEDLEPVKKKRGRPPKDPNVPAVPRKRPTHVAPPLSLSVETKMLEIEQRIAANLALKYVEPASDVFSSLASMAGKRPI